ncbi:hypothetical protein OIO90_004222 [Microbotryomycetes sp. JL221]|nr:hypothetical protein OIO90_004222 [Microbotryomycetes sp. JL221]
MVAGQTAECSCETSQRRMTALTFTFKSRKAGSTHDTTHDMGSTSTALSLEQALKSTAGPSTSPETAQHAHGVTGASGLGSNDSDLYTRRGSLFAPGPVQLSSPLSLSTQALAAPNEVNLTHPELTDLNGAPLASSQITTSSNTMATPTMEAKKTNNPRSGRFAGDRDEKQILSVEFLLVTGKRIRWTVAKSTPIAIVKESVWQAWPTGEYDLFMGKFLDDSRTLESYGIEPMSEIPTIVHLNIKPLLVSASDDAPIDVVMLARKLRSLPFKADKF